MKVLILAATGLVGLERIGAGSRTASSDTGHSANPVPTDKAGQVDEPGGSKVGAAAAGGGKSAVVVCAARSPVGQSLTILRPSIIEGESDEVRPAESFVLKLSHFLAPVLPKRFHVNPAPKIAKVLVDAVLTARKFHVGEIEAIALAHELGSALLVDDREARTEAQASELFILELKGF